MTKAPALYICSIQQKDNYTFTIEWNDGRLMDYRLADLQRLCPCAGCWDEGNQKRINHAQTTPDHLSAIKITSVGRYALHIHFSSGCSNGIYSYDFLHALPLRTHP
ncbi:DUF971 domain-containing protein [Parachlamydia sp. AcF125]|uniref:DUF971 domain-containing protein n=1 Tax=Parachlamydia sp. AcF125 TaxID=2795736 RepID=UPI001BC99755|nr:DUF971 domain-containing protein [Parachlamydia sp. AcF125]MBS4167912.1 hypothetical protein [Parachlamydia sp. AcF125]